MLETGEVTRLLLLVDIVPDERLHRLLTSLSKTAHNSKRQLTAVCSRLRYMNEVRESLPPDAAIKYAEDYLSADELKEIDKQAYGWIRNWYRLDCLSAYNSSLYYRNIPLGSLVEYELSHSFPQLLKQVKSASAMMSQEQPSMIVLFSADTDFKSAVRFVCHTLNCPVLSAEYREINTPQSHPTIAREMARVVGLAFDALLFFRDWCALKLLRKEREKSLILFENYDRLYPFINTIRASGDKRVMLIGNEGGLLNRIAALRKKRLYRALLYHLSPAAINRVRKARHRVAGDWDDIRNNVNFRSFFRDQDLDLWPLVEGKFTFVFNSLFPKAIGVIEGASRGLAFYNPRLIVLNSDVLTHGRAVSLIARQLGIPTLLIQHGVYSGYIGGYDVITADKVAAWGKSQVDSYVALGNDSSKIEVVGGYLFDELYHRSKLKDREDKGKERICRQLNLDSQKDIITFATTDTPPRGKSLTVSLPEDSGEVVFRSVVEAMREFPQKQLVVKLHPMEVVDIYQRVLKEMDWARERTRVIKQVNLHDLIDASELVITVPSTVALETIIMGKPLVILQIRKGENNTLYAQYPALNVWNKEDIAAAIKSTLGDSELRRTLEKKRAIFLSKDGEYLIDGKSTERIINLIDSMSR